MMLELLFLAAKLGTYISWSDEKTVFTGFMREKLYFLTS